MKPILLLIVASLLLVVGISGQSDSSRPQVTPSKDNHSARPQARIDSTSGRLRLNELLASNRMGRLDDQRQSSDWIEVHNPGNGALRLGGYRLTNDPNLLDKWAFPNNQISAGGYQIVWMSGLNRISLAPEVLRTSAATIPFEMRLIEAGADWKYLLGFDQEKVPNEKRTLSGWTTVGFDDSAFAVGAAGFGYGDEDDATKLPVGTTAILLRHQFILREPLRSESLVLQVDYDDGFAAYLNGTRVTAVNAPGGELGLDSLASGSHEAGSAERFDLSAHAGLLRPGKNLLAMAGLNTHRESSDMSLRVALGVLPAVCHANFRLKKEGGTLLLIQPDGSISDQVEYGRQMADQSFGRSALSPDEWGYFLTPTPGAANAGPQQPKAVKSNISFDPLPGAYDSGVEVRINQKSSAAVDIRFTNDGSEPVASSQLYQEPIQLADKSLFRAATFVGQERASLIVSATYLVGSRPVLPVLSISMKPADFLDVHLQSNATGHDSERSAFLELFTSAGDRTVATGFGLRLHGGAGRRGDLKTKKSYRTYFRQAYGEGRVNYPIIPGVEIEGYDKLVLRANSNDRAPQGANIRDQVIRDVHSDMGALAAGGSWYVLLINSTSRGVYNVTERMDEEFLASHLGPDEYDVIKTGETMLSGSKEGWDDLRQFIRSTDFSDDANFEQLSQRVDIEDFTSYIIVNLCLQNFDWPSNNWYAARQVPDGKWIFLCWDSEWGLGYRHPGLGDAPYGTDVDPYAFMDSGGAWGNGLIRLLFLAMIDNPGYCNYYQQQVRKHLSGPLAPQNIMRHINRHREAIESDLDLEYRARGYDKQRWYQQIKEVELFAQQCPKFFQKYTDEYFSYRCSPSADDRVALIEDADGRRYVIYRTAKGQLRELSSSADGSTWNNTAIRVPGLVPPPAGQLSAYALASGKRHVIYRGTSGHLHELSLSAKDPANNHWHHTNLTSLLAQPIARCDPSVTVVDNAPHIVYLDHTSRARELWFDGEWRHHPLPFAPRPASNVVISVTPAAFHVSYRTMFGVPCEQTLSREAAANGQRNWSHRIFHRLPAQGQPFGFNADGKRRIVFRVAEK